MGWHGAAGAFEYPLGCRCGRLCMLRGNGAAFSAHAEHAQRWRGSPHAPMHPLNPPQVMRVTAGRVLEEALGDVFLNGAKPVSEFESDRIATTVKELRLEPEVAKAVFSEVRARPSLTRPACQFELPGAPLLLLAYVQLLLVQLGSWPHAVWAGLCVHAATYTMRPPHMHRSRARASSRTRSRRSRTCSATRRRRRRRSRSSRSLTREWPGPDSSLHSAVACHLLAEGSTPARACACAVHRKSPLTAV